MNRERAGAGPAVDRLEVRAYTVPTDAPESDGTLEWDSTTAVVVRVFAGGEAGTGYTYSHPAAATVVRETLAGEVVGQSAFGVAPAWERMRRSVRNFGYPGIAAAAISAVDTALWDLEARLLGLPLVSLLGGVRNAVPVYGSGGFTSEPVHATIERFEEWAALGVTRFKMKVGRVPSDDEARVRAVFHALDPASELFVDANGAYRVAEAVRWAARFADLGIPYFEEPVSSDDVPGLREVREKSPPGLAVAAGEYAWAMADFRRLLEGRAVDVLQADVTRCGGFTGLRRAAALCEGWMVPLSTHTAQTLHAHAACALTPVVHVEYFHDHARVEELLFDGAARIDGGMLRPDLTRPGIGIELRLPDAERWVVAGGNEEGLRTQTRR